MTGRTGRPLVTGTLERVAETATDGVALCLVMSAATVTALVPSNE